MPTLVRRMHIGFELSPAQYRRLLGGSECAHFARHSSATSAYGRLRMAIQQEMYQSNSSALKLKSGMIFSSETGSSSHSTSQEEKWPLDRKRVGKGKGGRVRVDHGGRRKIKTKKKKTEKRKQ